MAQENAARLFKAVKQDQVLKAKLKATDDPETFVKIARDGGYNLTVEELETEIHKMSEEELASVVNPGMGSRMHLIPR